MPTKYNNFVSNPGLLGLDVLLNLLTKEAEKLLQKFDSYVERIGKALTYRFGLSDELALSQKYAENIKSILTSSIDARTGQFDLSRFNAALNHANMDIETMSRSLQSLGSEGRKAWNDIATEILSAEIPLQRSNASLSAASLFFMNSARWAAASRVINGTVDTISRAFSYALNLDKSLTNILIVTGHSADYMKNFANLANAAAKSLSASTLEYTNAALIYYQQGLSDKEVAERTATTVKMAHVTGDSVKNVASQMTSIWNNFSTGIDNLERYSDVVTKLGATTASSSKEISQGLSKFSSIANTVGLSYDYAASAVATVTAATRQSADSVGTSFKTLFSRLESLNLGETLDDGVTLNKYSQALMKIGVNVLDANGQLKDMDTILDSLGARWDSISKSQQVALAQTVGGVRNYTQLVSLMEHWDEFQQNVVTAQTSKGTLLAQADIYEKSWEAAQTRVLAAAQTTFQNLISGDFVKGLNNISAKVLNGAGTIGQALGTKGSVATLANLALGLGGNRLANTINKFESMTWGHTRAGITSQLAQLQRLLENEINMPMAGAAAQNTLGSVNDARIASLSALSSAWNNLSSQSSSIGFFDQFTRAGREARTELTASSIALTNVTNKVRSSLNALSDSETLLNRNAMSMTLITSLLTARNLAAGFTRNNGSYSLRNLGAIGATMGAGKEIADSLSNLYHEISTGRITSLQDIQSKIDSMLNNVRGAVGGGQGSSAFDAISNLSSLRNFQQHLGTLRTDLENAITNMYHNGTADVRLVTAAYLAVDNFERSMARGFTIPGLHTTFNSMEGPEGALNALINSAGGERSILGRSIRNAYDSMVASGADFTSKHGNISLGLDAIARSALLLARANADEYAFGSITRYERDERGELVLNNGMPVRISDKMITTGDFAMQSAMAINSLLAFGSSLDNLTEKMTDGAVTMSDVFATVGSGLMAFSMSERAIANNGVLTGIMGGGLGRTMASGLSSLGFTNIGTAPLVAESGALTAAGASVYIAAAIAAGELISDVNRTILAHSSNAILERANEMAILSSATAKEDKLKLDSFAEAAKKQSEAINKLNTLLQGTAQYTALLLTANELARDMIEAYNLKAGSDYNIEETGAIRFTGELLTNIYNRVETLAKLTATDAVFTNSRVTLLSNMQAIKDLEDLLLYKVYSDYSSSLIGDITTYNVSDWLNAAKSIISDTQYEASEVSELRDIVNNISTLQNENLANYLSVINAYTSNLNLTASLQLAARSLTLYSPEENLAAYLKELKNPNTAFAPFGLDWFVENGDVYTGEGKLLKESTLRELYSTIFGQSAAFSMTAEEIASRIVSNALEKTVDSQIKGLENTLFSGIDASEIAKYDHYRALSGEAFTNLVGPSSSKSKEGYNVLDKIAIDDYAKSVDALAQTVANNTMIDTVNLAELVSGNKLSIEQLETLNNYVANYGSIFGKETGTYIYDTLTKVPDSWNDEFFKALSSLNVESGIAGLYSLQQQASFLSLGDADLANALAGLQNTIKQTISDLGGLGLALFKSSDFNKVFNSILTSLSSNTNINTSDIAKMATKNATLDAYLGLTGDHYQSIVDLSEMVAESGLATSLITDSIVHAVETASGTADAAQWGLDTLEEQNLGVSYSEVDEYYQNGGKAWYTAWRNDMLNDTPFKNFLSDVLPQDQLDQWYNIMDLVASGALTTKEARALMLSEMGDTLKLLDTLAGTGKYAGKGGGGVDTYYAYLMSDAKTQLAFAQSGIAIDPKTGKQVWTQNFTAAYNTAVGEAPDATDVLVTTEGLLKLYTDTLKSITTADGKHWQYTEAQAERIAKLMVGSLSVSAVGYMTLFGDVALATMLMAQDMRAEGFGYKDVLDAFYDLHRAEYDKLAIDENGKIRDKVAGEEGISRQLYYQYLASLGVKIIGPSSSMGGYQGLDILGQRLAAGSEGTITSTDAAAFFEALEASNVGTYTGADGSKAYDYDELKSYLTTTMQLSETEANSAIEDVIEAGRTVVKTSANGWGGTSLISSAGMAPGEFSAAVATDTNFGQADFLNTAYHTLLLQFLTDHPDMSLQEAYGTFNEQWQQQVQAFLGEGGQYTKDLKNLLELPTTEARPDTPNGVPVTTTTGVPNGGTTSTITSTSSPLTTEQINHMVNEVGGYAWSGDTIWYQGPDGLTYTNHLLNEMMNAAVAAPSTTPSYTRSDSYYEFKARQDEERNLIKTSSTPTTTTTTTQAPVYSSERGLAILELMKSHPGMLESEAAILYDSGAYVPKDTLSTESKPESTSYGTLLKNTDGTYTYNGLVYGTAQEAANAMTGIVSGTPETGDAFGEVWDKITTAADSLSEFSIANNEQQAEALRTERQLQAAEWAKDLDKQLESYREDMDSTILSPISGRELTEQEAEKMAKDLHDIAENTADSVELLSDLNDVVESGDSNAFNKDGVKLPVDEEGNPVDEEGNVIDLGGNNLPETITEVVGGGGGSSSGGGDYSGGSGGSSNNSNNINPQDAALNIKDFFANGGGLAGNGMYIEGQAYDYIKDEDGGVVGFTAPDGTSYDMNGDPLLGQYATGYRNLIPKFAAGMKDGQIAITGELGPELHVKSDGSMDVLGKHGREYAWVEPNDRIYTAAQTASILGNKSIEELQGFSNGINNFIPGFFTSAGAVGMGTQEGSSSSGGDYSGGGGSFGGGEVAEIITGDQNHRYDANWLKYRDIIERYYTILQQIENITQAVSRFAEMADRAWGKERQKNLEDVIRLQEEQIASQRKYLSEISQYKTADALAMTSSIREFVQEWNAMYPNNPITFDDAEFDENGVLTNYNEIVQRMIDAYNMSMSGSTYAYGLIGRGGTDTTTADSSSYQAGSAGIYATALAKSSGSSRYSVNGGISVASSTSGLMGEEGTTLTSNDILGINYVNVDGQTKLQELLKDIQMYTQTLNLYEQQLIALEEMQEQLFDTRMQAIVIEYQFKATIRGNELDLIEYNLSKVRNDAYHAAEAIELIGQKLAKTLETLLDYQEELRDIFNLNINGDKYAGNNDLTITTNDTVNQLEKDLEKIKSFHQRFWDEASQSYVDSYQDEYATTIKETLKRGDLFSLSSFLGETQETNGPKPGEHSMAEYTAFVAEIYKKYSAMYSDLIPKASEFLQYTDELKEFIASSSGKDAESLLNGDRTSNILTAFSSDLFSGILNGGTTAEAAAPEYHAPLESGSIANAEEAIAQLLRLAQKLAEGSIYVDINKFTQEFNNINEVSNRLQEIFDSLIDTHSDLVDNITALDKGLISFNDATESYIIHVNNLADVQSVLDVLNKARRETLTKDTFDSWMQDPEKLWAFMTDPNENFNFTNFTANQISLISSIAQSSMESLLSLQEQYFKQIDLIGSSVKQYFKDIDAEANRLVHLKTIGQNILNILDLTGRTTTLITQLAISALNGQISQTAIKQINAAKEEYRVAERMLANKELADRIADTEERLRKAKIGVEEATAAYGDSTDTQAQNNLAAAKSAMTMVEQELDELNKQRDSLIKYAEEKREEFLKKWEEGILTLANSFTNLMRNAIAQFEEGFSPIYKSFELLSASMSRLKELRNLYAEDYEKAYLLSKLNRDIEQSILDTDNLHSKQELRKLQKEILDLQASGVKMSVYDLDVAQKRYDLELARQALEDARNAKSLVRLSRDNNGNWGYVYTANEDDIDEAELAYEDAAYEFAQSNEATIKTIEELYLAIMAQAEADINALNPSQYGSLAEYLAQVIEITDAANKKVAFLAELLSNALGNNEYLISSVNDKVKEILPGLTTTFADTTLAQKTGTTMFSQLVSLAADSLAQLSTSAFDAFGYYAQGMQDIADATEIYLNAGGADSLAATTVEELASRSEDLEDVIQSTMERAEDSFNKMMDAFISNTENMTDIITHSEIIIKNLQKLIKLSGDYIGAATVEFDSDIHSWDLLEKVYDALETNGRAWVKYIDDNGNEKIQELEGGTDATARWLSLQRERLGKMLAHDEASLSSFSTQAGIDLYYNDIMNKLKSRGLMYLDIKGALFDAAKDNAELASAFENFNELQRDEEGNILSNQIGTLKLDYANNAEKVEQLLKLLKALMTVAAPINNNDVGYSVGDSGDSDWYASVVGTNGYAAMGDSFHHLYGDTGMYTGEWQSDYTGEWPNGSVRRNGRLAWLHQKELVLNAHDTENMLDAMEIVRQLDNLTNWMANGLGVLLPTVAAAGPQELEQNVTITAEFPNATNHTEIEEALTNLSNKASQYANRKKK